jgi:A/G-specific adenine glycosylase
VWVLLEWRAQWWLVQRPDSGVWAGLWSLPEFDSGEAFDAVAATWPGEGEALDSFTHVLTHLDWRLHPIHWTLPDRCAPSRVEAVTRSLGDGRWWTQDEAFAAGLPAPLRKLLQSVVSRATEKSPASR